MAVDGGAGAGKSTLARRLAEHLRLAYVNTGLMYRALALLAVRRRVHPNDADALVAATGDISFELVGEPLRELAIEGAGEHAHLIAPEVEAVVSAVARHPQVRRVMRAEQRRLGLGGAVMEGRDIGTVVFPDAEVKIFLAGDSGVRARRRALERLHADAARAVARRDEFDARTNPLEPAAGAVVIDTTDLTPDEVFDRALAIVERELAREGS